jgi:hypothetical protein
MLLADIAATLGPEIVAVAVLATPSTGDASVVEATDEGSAYAETVADVGVTSIVRDGTPCALIARTESWYVPAARKAPLTPTLEPVIAAVPKSTGPEPLGV